MRKTISLLAMAALCAGLFTQSALALQKAAPASEANEFSAVTPAASSQTPGARWAEALSAVTGVAISPLLGAGGYGAVKYFRTPEVNRPNLPWFAQPWFWIPALSVVALCFLKDTAGTALPTALKKPLDVVDTVEHKVSGLIAAGAFVPLIAILAQDWDPNQGTATLSSAGFATANLSWIYDLIAVPMALIVFAIVFLASNAINILILLSPFTTVDAALKGFRTSILALVAGTAWLNPWLGAAFAIVVIFVSYFFAGWSLRLTHFGFVFLWDLFTGRSNRFQPDAVSNKMYLSRKLNKVPARTYGRLSRDAAGKLILTYRPWLILPQRTLELPEGNYETGRGLLYSEIVRVEGNDAKSVLLLPPRYRGHEDELGRIYGFNGTRDVGLRAMWKWFKELCGFRVQPQLAAA